VWPVDFTQPLAEPQTRRFDLVTAMAILEHLPNSPEPIMANIRACTKPDGLAAIEVPNIAYWPNRVRALKGQSIHQPFELLYQSASPFTGHHREYTAQELGSLLSWTGFNVVSIERFNYSMDPRSLPTAELIRLLIFEWPTLLIDSCRELILAMARPTATAARGHTEAAGAA
jgi:SAM-dependent methyltransferase